MLTNEDIQKLSEIVATKDDVEELKEKTNSLEESIQTLIISVDKLTKTIENFNQEYVFTNSKLARHEKWN